MEEEIIVQSPSLFKQFLNYVVKIFYLMHKYILSLNDQYAADLSDKDLHFLVIGCLGMFFLFIVYPVFKWLIEKDKTIFVAWIYVFTILIAITLLIEIGQDISGTGDMDFGDVVAGLFGFIIMSFGFLVCHTVYIKIFKKK